MVLIEVGQLVVEQDRWVERVWVVERDVARRRGIRVLLVSVRYICLVLTPSWRISSGRCILEVCGYFVARYPPGSV